MSGTLADKFADIPTELRPRDGGPGPQDQFDLWVTAGADQGRHLRLDASTGRALIGQSTACDFRLQDPSVSRRHASVELLANGSVRLCDLSSSNGTFVNRVAIFDVALRGGERIELGATVLELRRVEGETPAAVPEASHFGRVIGSSLAMRRLYPVCQRLAASSLPIVIEGETGTGKELLAEAIHEASTRAKGPFVVFDCTTITSSLAEAALFGHERGAFTGAVSARRGIFEEADGGTLLIDEIGDLDLGLQAKLLRALERSEIRRLGGEKWVRVNVRIITATRRDLDREVQAGRFRDDLFFRIAVGRVELPPLRERAEDIRTLVQHFWTELGGAGAVPADALERFASLPWPGNVRELHHAVARLLAMGELGTSRIRPGDSSPGNTQDDELARVLALDLPLPTSRALLVAEFERRYVSRVLEKHGGRVAEAAAASGIARRYFQLLKARQGKA